MDIAKWIADGSLDPRLASRATKKNHKHDHSNPARPSRGNISMAEYRRRSKENREARKRRRRMIAERGKFKA